MSTAFLVLAQNGVKTENIIYCSYAFCAVAINLLLLINYVFIKKLKNLSSVVYSFLLVTSLLASLFNLFAILQAVITGYSTVLADVSELLFYLFFNISGLLFFDYVSAIIYGKSNKLPLYCNILSVVFFGVIVGDVVVASLALFAEISALADIYKWFVFGSQLTFMACTLITTIVHRKTLVKIQVGHICVFMGLMIVACILQPLSYQAQVCSFCLALALMFIYLTIQHAETEVDAVTGMFNMQSYVRRTNEKLNQGKSFYVFAFELNNMVLVNTTFGIAGGNRVLKEVAVRAKALLPKKVFLYRLDGARFAINFAYAAEKDAFCKQFHTVFENSVAVGSTEIKMEATACVIKMPTVTDKVDDIHEILRYYRSSAKTADTIFVADSDSVNYSRRRELVEYAIQNALKNRSLMVYYQPIYSIEKKCVNCCEALVRLKDPDLGFIGPDEFIPIAEETGRIVEVGKFVMEEVCRFIRDEQPQRYGIEFIDVNLSVIQFMRKEIIDDIVAVLKDYDVPRSMVNLEITETASAKSYSVLQSRLMELHSSGFTISLDDFGSGFSSVEYLIKFPFDVVKLDKSIVWAYMGTDKYEPILKHYMPMLHALGMKIVAEGVETEEMLSALEELGCDYIQGFYFSKPIPGRDFIEYIKRNLQNGNIA